MKKAVERSLHELGGMERFVAPGEKVFLKLNLLRPSEPEKAVTTHPSVIRAVLQLIEEVGASVVVGDSPGGPFSKGRLEKCYRKSGVYEAIEGTGAELNWDTGYTRAPNPHGHLVHSFEIINAALEADKIISLPRLKTHVLTGFTGGVKIMYGVVPGLVKATYHAKLPDVKDFSDMLLDILTCTPPTLAIMDAVVGMEGQGPSAGRPKKVGAILTSSDSVAMDVVACSLVGLDPLTSTTTERAVARGLGTGRLEDVEVKGNALANFEDIRFEPAKRKKGNIFPVPAFLLDLYANRYTKPVVDRKKCTGCGECASACPRNCISMKNGKAVMDYKQCIRCFCCHELCPESAIRLR